MEIKIKNANPYGILTEERLIDFEKRLGTSLPSDYRNFVLQYNGGVPEPAGFWVKENSFGDEVYLFYGLHNGPMWFSIDFSIGDEQYGIPKGLIAIGEDGGGNFICLGIEEGNKGDIFFLDHEIHPYDNPNSLDGITKLANSFSEFISNFREIPH